MKSIKFHFVRLGVILLVAIFFAITYNHYPLKYAAANYLFSSTVTPTTSSVIVAGNYVISQLLCPLPRAKYCGITIDPSAHPEYVTTGGALNFSNSTLVSTVQ